MKKVVIITSVALVLVLTALGWAARYEIGAWRVKRVLPSCRRMLLANRPMLGKMPKALPQHLDMSVTNDPNLKRIRGILSTVAKCNYMIIFKDGDVVLCADYDVVVGKIGGKPKGLLNESARVLYTSPRRKKESGGVKYNVYYGNLLNHKKLDEYLKLLAKTGDVPEVRKILGESPQELNWFREDDDAIQELRSELKSK